MTCERQKGRCLVRGCMCSSSWCRHWLGLPPLCHGQAGMEAGRREGRQAGKKAGRRAGRQEGTPPPHLVVLQLIELVHRHQLNGIHTQRLQVVQPLNNALEGACTHNGGTAAGSGLGARNRQLQRRPAELMPCPAPQANCGRFARSASAVWQAARQHPSTWPHTAAQQQARPVYSSPGAVTPEDEC
jgi:hypothetical protein